MIRTAAAPLLLIALAPLPAPAQSGFVFGEPPTMTNAPRALEIFAHIEGYAEFTPDRHGTPTQPLPTTLGTDLVMRIFRNTCLGAERGLPHDAITPQGFAPYETLPYSFGDVTAPNDGQGSHVLSSTGSIDADEEIGHPFIWLTPEPTGMTCRVEWHMGPDLPEDAQAAIASYLDGWVPWAFALVHAAAPYLGTTTPPSHVAEWDRPCGDRWCPMVVLYSFSGGYMTIETTLNITDIQGDRP
ncbi:hypothetical protein [Gymnodinialimonas sp.]